MDLSARRSVSNEALRDEDRFPVSKYSFDISVFACCFLPNLDLSECLIPLTSTRAALLASALRTGSILPVFSLLDGGDQQKSHYLAAWVPPVSANFELASRCSGYCPVESFPYLLCQLRGAILRRRLFTPPHLLRCSLLRVAL